MDPVPRVHCGAQGVRRYLRALGDFTTSPHVIWLGALAVGLGVVSALLAKGLLARIPVELPDRMPDYGLITRLGEPPTPPMQAFMEVLREVASPVIEVP